MTTESNNLFYLHFNAQSTHLPYAEVATFLLATSKGDSSVGIKSNELRIGHSKEAKESTLILPAGKWTEKRTRLNGKSCIIRYFTRIAASPSGSSLYEGCTVPVQSEIDDFIDAGRRFGDQKSSEFVINKLRESVKSEAMFLASNKQLTLADIIVWDLIKTQKISSASHPEAQVFLERLETCLPELKQAAAKIRLTQMGLPAMDLFRAKVLEQMTSITGVAFETLDKYLEVPKIPKSGTDMSIAVPPLRLVGNPAQLAQEFASKFQVNDYIIKCFAGGVFLNFCINRNLLFQTVIPQILTLETDFGSNASGFGKSAVVEYSSPNIAKPFHAGHLRSTIIGNFVRNVLNQCGWKTIAINYLGDWGKQYGLLAVGYQRYGDKNKLAEDAIKHLFDVYVKINADKESNPEIDNEARAYFKKMEEGDTAAIQLWKEFRDLSIEKYKEMYHRLNIAFDIYSGESQYSYKQMEAVLHELRALNLLKVSQGAEILDMNEHGLGAAVIAKSDGSMLYLSRDIAAAIERQEEFKFDKMFYIVATQQFHHFKQLFKILELMGKPWSKNCHHIDFGMIKGMSTRKGNVVFLQEILDHTQDEMHQVMKNNAEKYSKIHEPLAVADCVAISSIMIQDMSARRNKDYAFDWARMLSFEGDTGPYLQYAHARLCSMERTANIQIDLDKIDYSLLVEPQAHALVDWIARYPLVVAEVSDNLEPCTVVTYLYELAHRISAAWEVLWVMGREPEVAHARMAVYKSARITLGNALALLGLRQVLVNDSG